MIILGGIGMYLDMWYPAPFTIRGNKFDCVGHYIAYRRAIAVKDIKIANYIKHEHVMHLVRALGDSCDAEKCSTWHTTYGVHLEDAVRAKFMQNDDLLEVFLTSSDIVKSALRSENDDFARFAILKIHAQFKRDRSMSNWLRRTV